MHSLTYKLAAIFLTVVLIPLGIGIGAALTLRHAVEALNANDRSLHDLANLVDSVNSALEENARLQKSAQSATKDIADTQEKMYRALKRMGDVMLPRSLAVAQIRFAIADVSASERALLLALNMRHIEAAELAKTRETQIANIGEAMASIEDCRKRFIELLDGNEDRIAWDEFERSLAAWRTNHRDFMTEVANLEALVEDLVRGGPLFAGASRKAYDTMVVKGKSARDAFKKGIDALNRAIVANVERNVTEALASQVKSQALVRDLDRESSATASKAVDLLTQIDSARHSATDASVGSRNSLEAAVRRFWYFVIFSAVGVCAAVAIGLILSWRITSLIRRMTVHMSRIAEGDLTADVPGWERERKDEIGQMARMMQYMILSMREEITLAGAMAEGDYTRSVSPRSDRDQLGKAFSVMIRHTNDTLAGVSLVVDRVGKSAAIVSAASRSLTDASLTSASAIEEISRTVAHVDQQAKENAEHARRANSLATSSRDAAERGYGAVTELVLAMDEIQQAGKQIASVAKLIDDIAFQTNLLALNAAVEAARAGRHGKGFSVVADEVRNLSGRSAKAARETGKMILSMAERVEAGANLAQRTDSEFRAIVDATAQVAQLFEDITSASNAQSVAVAQISQSLAQIDDVTRENTTNANNTSASAQTLLRQAGELQRMVSRFRLDVGSLEERERVTGGPPRHRAGQIELRTPESRLLTASAAEAGRKDGHGG